MKELLTSMIIDAVKNMYAELKVAPVQRSYNKLTGTKIPTSYDVVAKYKTIFGTVAALADAYGDDTIKSMIKTANDNLPEEKEQNVLGL